VNRYLVTGCAGFIGSKVTELLLQDGHHVTGIDTLNDAYDSQLKWWRLAHLQGAFQFHRVDIADMTNLENCFGDFTAVIHLAARAGVRPSVDNPWIYQRTNIEGTLNLLELCRRRNVHKFVLASTSSLYGNAPVPFHEDSDTDHPLSPYAASKKAAEALAYTYHHLHGIDVTIFRYFTVYGPAGRPDMAIFRFVRQITEGEPVTLFGTQRRDFTYVDDIAQGTIAGLTPLGYEVINLGGDRPISVSNIIERIGHLTGQEPIIKRKNAHPADVTYTWASILKARGLLNWTPQTDIHKGLQNCVDWYSNNRQMAKAIRL
jgi:UDP-glucuronate 4-epimerase